MVKSKRRNSNALCSANHHQPMLMWDMEGSYKYTKYISVMDSWQGVVLQLQDWARG